MLQMIEQIADHEVSFAVHRESIKLRFLDRRTLALCCAQLWLVLDKTSDLQLRGDLMAALDDLIRQDAIQAALGLSDDFTGD